MRIIAGQLGGRKLISPPSDATRPITDRAKQSLFDILAPTIEGSLVYDCFAGTGSLGLESLSRGAKFVTFFEADRPTVARLNQNVMALKLSERCRIVQGDLFKWFQLSITRPGSTDATGADIVFVDPPYRFLTQHSDELLQLSLHLTHAHVKPESIVVFRHDGKNELELPNLSRFDLREYGDMTIEFLHPASKSEGGGESQP